VAFIVRYVGATPSVDDTVTTASNTITFKQNGAADTTLECPIVGGLGGIIDTSNAACDTLGEVVDTINGSADWEAVLLDGLRSDATGTTQLLAVAASDATGKAGLNVYFDTTVTITGTHSLYNVYLSGGTHTVTGGDTLTALGTLTLDNGTINGGTMAAAGPLTQLSTFDGGTGLLRVVGTGNQTFDGFATIGAGNLPAFEIDKPSGILTLSGTIRTTNDWTHLSGTVDPDASLVVFSTGLTIDAAGMTFADLQALAVSMARVRPLTPAAFRDATGTSRRYVMALLEELGRRGALVRTDAGHVPGPRAGPS